MQFSRDVHLFVIDPNGTFPQRLPIPMGNDADVSPDSRAIAYSQMPPPMLQSLTQWKTYRGGSASRVAIMSSPTHTVRKIPQPPSRCNDLNPMWIGGKVYFDSDRDGEFNLHSFDPATGEVRQLRRTGFPGRERQHRRRQDHFRAGRTPRRVRPRDLGHHDAARRRCLGSA